MESLGARIGLGFWKALEQNVLFLSTFYFLAGHPPKGIKGQVEHVMRIRLHGVGMVIDIVTWFASWLAMQHLFARSREPGLIEHFCACMGVCPAVFNCALQVRSSIPAPPLA